MQAKHAVVLTIDEMGYRGEGKKDMYTYSPHNAISINAVSTFALS